MLLSKVIYNLPLIDPFIHSLTHRWLQAPMQGTGPIIGSSWGSPSCSRTLQHVDGRTPAVNGQPSLSAEPRPHVKHLKVLYVGSGLENFLRRQHANIANYNVKGGP